MWRLLFFSNWRLYLARLSIYLGSGCVCCATANVLVPRARNSGVAVTVDVGVVFMFLHSCCLLRNDITWSSSFHWTSGTDAHQGMHDASAVSVGSP